MGTNPRHAPMLDPVTVITRSPTGRWIFFDGAAISHLIPAVENTRAKPSPVGPAS
jgi:hypothetical protein